MLEIEKEMTIKQLVEYENYVIIPDTNVLLNLYRYAPDYTEFAYNCFDAVMEYIILPTTVRYEYGKHCRGCFSKMENRSKTASEETRRQIALAKQKISDSCCNLERLKFPDISELRNNLSAAMDKVQNVFDDFFRERQAIEVAESSWGGEDKLMNLVVEIEKAGHIMSDISYEDVYRLTNEGEKRYRSNTPPGFMDAKNKEKEGLSKYADYFIWMEILGYAKEKHQNVIFVTDDVKEDWWDKESDPRRFHPKLIEEFLKTKQQIVALTSMELFEEISSTYLVEKPDIVNIALNMTDNEYCQAVSDVVFDRVEDQLVYNLQDYIDEYNTHIGSEGLDEVFLDDWVFESYCRIGTHDSSAKYYFK